MHILGFIFIIVVVYLTIYYAVKNAINDSKLVRKKRKPRMQVLSDEEIEEEILNNIRKQRP